MIRAWRGGDPGDDELERLFADDREAWRGDLHQDAEPFGSAGDPEAWRGEDHLADWPESSAGPEYWMHKRAAEGW